MPDTIIVRIPPTTAHVSLLRAAASALAARLDFTVDRITEFQIAVDEACSRLIAVADSPTYLEMRFQVEGGTISLVASVDGARRDDRELLTEWSRVILEAIARNVSPAYADGSTSLTLQVAKAGG